jgi:peptidoglycan/xylan/chitin deacetylase (PgdA/CDA1 family)
MSLSNGAPRARLAWTALGAAGAFRLGRHVHRRAVAILTYHQVQADGPWTRTPRHPNVVAASEFERQVAHLRRRYHIISGPEFEQHVVAGAPLPPHAVLLTFDDGYRDNFTQAFPILRQYGATAIFFVTTGFVGNRENRLWLHEFDALVEAVGEQTVSGWLIVHAGAPADVVRPGRLRPWAKRLSRDRREEMLASLRERFEEFHRHSPDSFEPMSWDEVKALADGGMTIGSHTVTHQIVGVATRHEVRDELNQSRARLESRLQRPCTFFSYPNGEADDFRPDDVEDVKAAGYSCAFTQIQGLVTRRSDPYAIPRLAVPGSADFDVFLSRVSGVHSWLQSTRARSVQL